MESKDADFSINHNSQANSEDVRKTMDFAADNKGTPTMNVQQKPTIVLTEAVTGGQIETQKLDESVKI